jgi:methylenetetrahydromethanopterin dehydrogenase
MQQLQVLPQPVRSGKTSLYVVSDGPTKKEAREALEQEGFGYIIPPVDPLIGAKREFLDPVEMASFNSDVMKVLSICGCRLIRKSSTK